MNLCSNFYEPNINEHVTTPTGPKFDLSAEDFNFDICIFSSFGCKFFVAITGYTKILRTCIK